MVKKIRFPLEMDNDVKVRTIDELRENFNLEKVIKYYLDGKLKTWLQHRNYTEELSQLEDLQYCDNKNEIPSILCKIFNVEQSYDLKFLELEKRERRLYILNSFSDSEEWEKKLEFVAFTQEELEEKLLSDNLYSDISNKTYPQRRKVYLCGEMFTVSDNFKNISYIGINTPLVKIVSTDVFDAKTNNIEFENVKITSDINIEVRIKEYRSCIIDHKKVSIKNTIDVKYCKTFIKNGFSAVVDYKGDVHIFGSTANGQGRIPKFETPIIDIDSNGYFVVAVDKNGKVYQWGHLPYKCPMVPNDLPKIKQIAAGSHIIIALDEFGKLHWWGGWDSDKIFYGAKNPWSGEVQFKPMPNITSKIIQIACSSDVVMALDEEGKVYSWGYCSEIPVHNLPKDLPFIKKIALFGRGDFAFALDEYGKIHFWGKDVWGCSNIPKDLPFIVDITKYNSIAYSALDENGKVHVWGECAERYYDGVKKLPKLKHLIDIGGIDENGFMYDSDRILFDGLKAMLPNE